MRLFAGTDPPDCNVERSWNGRYIMDTQFLFMLSAIALPVVFALFWWEYKTSGCAYGGSTHGTDNWLLTSLKSRYRRYRKKRALREPRDVSDI